MQHTSEENVSAKERGECWPDYQKPPAANCFKDRISVFTAGKRRTGSSISRKLQGESVVSD